MSISAGDIKGEEAHDSTLAAENFCTEDPTANERRFTPIENNQ
ncbi:MAG TPA: hypothetical protein VJ719_15115 [Chthoniobacterales bacterium]|nr:hypothetical protein [Chthoniobacterales bacterium]